MVLINGALALVLLALVALAVVVFSRPRGERRRPVPVSHAERLTALPQFRRSLRRARLLLAAALAALALAAGSALLGVARPAEVATYEPDKRARDVMLCLDASGSMMASNATILRTYEDIVERFDGERIGLTIFDSSAVQAFPLTDDYDLVLDTLADVRTGFETYGTEGMDVFSGTYDGGGSSLIGDGLAACVDGFDDRESERSGSIIFASDNYLAGEPIFTLPEATDLARDAGIRVYVLAPSAPSVATDDQSVELQSAADDTGGVLYSLADTSTQEVVAEIQSTEAGLVRSEPRTLVLDRSALPLGLTALSLVVAYACLWRVRL